MTSTSNASNPPASARATGASVPGASVPGTSAPGTSAPILVVDDSALCRDVLCNALHANGFTTTTAADGSSGFAEIAKRRPAVIVLDNVMPKMSGLAFLRALREDTRWSNLPVVMVSASNTKEVLLEAMRCKVSGYLLKEKMSMPALLSRIRAAIQQGVIEPAESPEKTAPAPQKQHALSPVAGTVSAPNLVSRDATVAAVVDCDTAKTLAGVLKQVAAINEASKAGVAEISAIVRQDPMLAMRIIQLAGSSAFAGSKTRIASVDDAVRVVGVSAVRELAVKIGVFSAFPEDRADGINLLRCWQHAFAVAAVMERIVPKTDNIPTGQPHLIGLCHDLAEILLRQKFPAEFNATVDYARQFGVSTVSLLPSVFGISYAEVTLALFARLKFPVAATEVINAYFRPRFGATTDCYKGMLSRSLAIANFMAHGMLLTSSTDDVVSPILTADCRSELISSATINTAEIRSEAITAVCVLADLGGAEEKTVSEPLITQRAKHVVYIRHPAFAQLDPLELALKRIAQCELRDQIPLPAELSTFDAIVVVAPSSGDVLLSAATRQVSQMSAPIPLLKLAALGDAAEVNENNGVTAFPISTRALAEFVGTLADAK